MEPTGRWRSRATAARAALGALPRFCAERKCFVYERLLLPYSGGILIAAPERWPPRFCRTPSKKQILGFEFPFDMFEDFHELTFDGGRLTNATDKSNAVKEIIRRIVDERWRPSKDEVAAWIESTFAFSDYQDYHRSL
jgi:hypothetical protein